MFLEERGKFIFNPLVTAGSTKPLGAKIHGDSVNFALYSHHATAVILGVFNPRGDLLCEIPLHRTGDIWHVAVTPFPKGGSYAFRIEGPAEKGLYFEVNRWLADPYATALLSPTKWGEKPDPIRSVQAVIGPRNRPFDWDGVTSPNHPKQDLVIYEMHVRGFTKHPSSKVSAPGTFQGILEKIDYLKKLGVNAIELMPIFEFDETHNPKSHHLNYWGYSPLHFFSPMRRYAKQSHDPFGPIDEFKTLVRELHRNGIEVILDVVYNHSGEGKDLNYKINYRGIDHRTYYMLDEESCLRDYTGCGNCLNANHPIVQNLILDSLRYWVEEFQIDGFRFDLAAILTRDTKGEPMARPPILQAIYNDPVISKVKLIAEVWDAAGLYLAGFFSKWHWSEWNGQFRDHVRKFIKGDPGEAGTFANSLCGSDFIYGNSKTPLSSINFITSHDGFTLRDLVSYNHKHNQANGENNEDGSNTNDSWNCGVEGVTNDSNILELRERQMRNFLLVLFLSVGIPMLSMRDEYGHSCQGNNNPYVQDNEMNWFQWNQREEITDYISHLIKIRKNYSIFRQVRFLTDEDIQWHGPILHSPDFSSHSRFIAYRLVAPPSFYIAFNAHNHSVAAEIPKGKWEELVHTGKNWKEQGFIAPPKAPSHYKLPPYSAILLRGC